MTANEALLFTSYVTLLHQILSYSGQMFSQGFGKTALPSVQAKKQLSFFFPNVRCIKLCFSL